MWHSNFQWFAVCWTLNIWSEFLSVLRRDVYRLQFMSFSAMPVCCLCHTYHIVCCICLDAVFRTIVIAHPFVLFSYCAESLLLHHVSPSFIDVCLVLFCSAPSSLLHQPVWAACTWGLMCFQLCLSLPLQEWTLRNTFRSVRRRNDRGSIGDTGWRRAEVWSRAKLSLPRN